VRAEPSGSPGENTFERSVSQVLIMLAKLRESQAPMHALLSLPAALVRKWDLSLLCFALQKSKIKNQNQNWTQVGLGHVGWSCHVLTH